MFGFRICDEFVICGFYFARWGVVCSCRLVWWFACWWFVAAICFLGLRMLRVGGFGFCCLVALGWITVLALWYCIIYILGFGCFCVFVGFDISGSLGTDWLLQPADLAWLLVFWFVFGSFWCL